MPQARSVHDWMEAVRSKERRPDTIDQLLPNGNEFMLIAGRPGVGKTNLGIYVALCLATGTNFFRFECKTTRVTFLTFENTEEKLLGRLEKIMPCFPDPGSNFKFEVIKPMTLERKRVELTEYFEETDVVMLDPLRWMIFGDYCKPEKASEFLTLLKETAIAMNLSFILCHHVKKPQGFLRIEPDDLYQLKGATEYVDSATTVLLLEKAKHKRKASGQFELAAATKDSYMLYFAKARDAIAEIEPLKLHFNRDKLLFEEERDEGT